jgi:hypothetical protein
MLMTKASRIRARARGQLRLSGAVAVLAAVFISGTALADTVTGPDFPPPGGVAYVGSGGATDGAGGHTFTYTGFDPSAYGSLYFTMDDAGGNLSLTGHGTTSGSDLLTYNAALSNLPGGIAVFSGQTTVPVTSGTQTVFTEFVLTLTSSGSPVPLVSAASIAGMPAADGAALQITPSIASAGFSANSQFLMSYSSSGGFEDAVDFYNAIPNKTDSTGSALQANSSGAFYASPVPLPDSAWLLLSALVGGGLLMRRNPGGRASRFA